VHDVDLVFDLVGGETQERSWAVLKRGGILVSTVSEPAPGVAAARQARGVITTARPSGELLHKIGALIELGDVKPIVQSVLPLSQAPEALEANRRGHSLGKTVLRVA
jgi:NADPH:quinone reductase-like Zn-dependent oxidoreductase